MTHAERLNLALEFNKKFVANNFISKSNAKEILVKADLTQEEIESLQDLYDEWEANKNYAVGDYVKYNDTLYKVIQIHASQSDWLPNTTASLYTIVQAVGVIEEWGVRNLTTNPFMIGEQVKFEAVIYESIIDNNVWTPTDYPAGWQAV
jgi:hypothetical protein